jgi:hypothetical protein
MPDQTWVLARDRDSSLAQYVWDRLQEFGFDVLAADRVGYDHALYVGIEDRYAELAAICRRTDEVDDLPRFAEFEAEVISRRSSPDIAARIESYRRAAPYSAQRGSHAENNWPIK